MATLIATLRSNSPTPLLPEEAAAAQEHAAGKLNRLGGVAAPEKQQQQQQNTAAAKQQAPSSLQQQVQHKTPSYLETAYVVADDSKPDLGDLGIQFSSSCLLRLPGLPA
jgi:hypothetical protein